MPTQNTSPQTTPSLRRAAFAAIALAAVVIAWASSYRWRPMLGHEGSHVTVFVWAVRGEASAWWAHRALGEEGCEGWIGPWADPEIATASDSVADMSIFRGNAHDALGFGYARAAYQSTYNGETRDRVVWMPLWAPAALLLIGTVLLARKPLQIRRRRALCLCLDCGYDVRGMATRCPECGTAIADPRDVAPAA